MNTATMRGPADADRFRVQVGRSRRYQDTLPPCDLRPTPHDDDTTVPAMSTVKNAEGKGGLVPWAAGIVAATAVNDQAAWTAMSDDDAIEWLKTAHERGRDKAAKRGTNVHTIIERLLDGRPPSVFDGDAGHEYLPAIEAFVTEWAPTLRYAEVVAFGNVNGDEWAGTFDAIVDLGPLGLRMVDYKSRKADANNPHNVYAGEVCQLGGYSSADYIIVEDPDTGEAVRHPMPHLDGLALVTFTPDNYDVHPIDLDPARDAWHRLFGWWRGEHIAKGAVTARRARPYPPHKVKPLEDMTKAELIDKANEVGATFTASMVKAVLIDAIRAHTSDQIADETPAAPTPAPVETVDAAADNLAQLSAAKPAPEPDDEGNDHAVPDELEQLRTELADNITRLLTLDGGENALRQRWPDNVPRLGEVDNGEHLIAIGNAVTRAEADIGAPFDPPPSTPAPVRSVETPTPAPTVDEGVDVGPDDLTTITTALALLEPDQETWLNNLVAATGNLSLKQRPTVRRARLAWALVRLAAAGFVDNDVVTAVLNAADVTTTGTDPARRLAALSADHAKTVSDIVSDLIDNTRNLVVNEDGTYAVTPF